MKKTLALVMLLVTVCSIPMTARSANIVGSRYGVQRPKLTRTAPSSQSTSARWSDTMTAVDSATIVGVADSLRSGNVNTDGWDWTEVLGGKSTGSTPIVVAKVTLFVPPGTAMAESIGVDTLNFFVEPSFDGGNTYVIDGRNYVQTATALPQAAAIGNILTLSHPSPVPSGGSTGGVEYTGFLLIDNDTQPSATGATNMVGIHDFRLKIFGDYGSNGRVGPLSIRIDPINAIVVK